MKIGIALFHLEPKNIKGVTMYSLNVLAALKKIDKTNEYYLLVRPEHSYYFEQTTQKNFQIVKIKSFSYKPFLRKIKSFLQNYIFVLPGLNIFYEKFDKISNRLLIKEIDFLGLNLIYFPTTVIYPLSINTKVLVSLHDIQFYHFPQFFSFITKLQRKISYDLTVKKAQYIQASSNFSKNDFVEYFKCSPDKISLIKDGVDDEFRKKISSEEKKTIIKKYSLPEDFIFYPAQHWIHKNHITLLKGIHLLKIKELKIPLVLTGTKRKYSDKIYSLIKSLGICNQIIFIGNVPLNDLIIIYKLSRIVCIPSLHESNSLPLIEALVGGVATVASDIPPNIEINTNGAISIFKKYDYVDLALKLRELWTNPKLREDRINKGYAISSDYSWDKTAEDYISLFKLVGSA